MSRSGGRICRLHYCKLANAGKGPDEYSSILSYTVDENKDILYYGHQRDWNHIFAINLKDGQPMGAINTRCLPRHMQIVKGNILCFPFSSHAETRKRKIPMQQR